MLANFRRHALAAALTAVLLSFSFAAAARDKGPTVDLGSADPTQTLNVTLVLKVQHPEALEQFVYQTATPGSPQYGHFLSTAQFASRFGPSDNDLKQISQFLQKNGITQVEVLPSHLAIRATGTLGQFTTAFQTPVHDYERDGHRFHRPSKHPVLPVALSGTLVVAAGLSNEPRYLSHRVNSNKAGTLSSAPAIATLTTASGSTATNTPGEYTVGDVANFYNINPLYKAGINGKGSTIGIVTLAGFIPQDAYDYWSLIGLQTKPNRITQIHVDGGGVISSDAGSGETSLDVEQSGGLAPFADLRVYDAPNTSGGFLSAFYQAVSENIADSISVSWGEPEEFYFDSPLSGGDYTGELVAFHQVFLEAAAQGISMFAATGDSGAYDTVRDLGNTAFSAPLTVDAPAADPFITAAGGTTVPFTFSFSGGPTASIDQEQVWGWDYLQTYLDKVRPGVYDLFSVGGGGGVSVFWPTPLYQLFTPGIRKSEPGQSLVAQNPSQSLEGYTQTTPLTLLNLKANFAGRNVPDIAFNADPETGYLLISSTDAEDGVVTGEGGTSFVAPQLNGVAALLKQNSGHRIGFWNPQLYLLTDTVRYGKYSPFTDIKAGDNWFYHGKGGYEPGAGIGTLNVGNYAQFLKAGL
ncbi:subtilase family serine protease [Luteibacter sp. Sphag1AF]|uniref:S53 family peptidase n=1 Tax=Luteibacter sp. Sphag1AF TaxID=2587031 RepID=UPI00161E30E8|nr:S53 family peptidase [Luteibacter sp. Sphag1AF]MBB3226748.1 subtilase family serine protease [Luteibacter sp. Sphag1AF]